MSAIQLSDKDFEEKVIKSGRLVLVDFYADWCGPCKIVSPVIEELAKEYGDKLVVGKLDVDNNQTMAGKYGVMSIPTVVLFNKGKEVDRLVGAQGKEGYEGMIKGIVK